MCSKPQFYHPSSSNVGSISILSETPNPPTHHQQCQHFCYKSPTPRSADIKLECSLSFNFKFTNLSSDPLTSGVFKCYIIVFEGGGVWAKMMILCSDDAWGRVGGSKPKWWCADTLKVRGGRLETLSKYCCKILEIMNKLMNFFMNHGLIFLNTAPTPQNIILMIVEKHIFRIETCIVLIN